MNHAGLLRYQTLFYTIWGTSLSLDLEVVHGLVTPQLACPGCCAFCYCPAIRIVAGIVIARRVATLAEFSPCPFPKGSLHSLNGIGLITWQLKCNKHSSVTFKVSILASKPMTWAVVHNYCSDYAWVLFSHLLQGSNSVFQWHYYYSWPVLGL